MEKLFINIFQMSISSSYLILAVLLVRFLLRKAPKGMRSFLWLLVGIRLLIPFSVESVFSLIPSTQVVDEYIYDTVQQKDMNTISNIDSMGTLTSQPISSTFIPSAEKRVDKTQATVQICTKIWFIGMVLMFTYLFVSWIQLKSRVKMSIPLVVALDCGSGKIYQKIYQSNAIESPFLFGIIRPRIYVPNGVTDEELPYVVQHEMTHLRRKDYLIKPVGFFLLSVYWFNPCVWIAYLMLCKDIELICDEKVIEQLGASSKKAYSQALLNSASNRHIIAACPVAFGEVSVRERVKNVLNYKRPAFWALVAAVLACIVVPVCFMTQKKKAEPIEITDNVENAKQDSEFSEVISENAKQDSEFSEAISEEEYYLNDLSALPGTYEMLNPDKDKYLMAPSLILKTDSQFYFSYDLPSSYFCAGQYYLTEDNQYVIAEDENYHYQFIRTADGILLRFDADTSSIVSRADETESVIAPVQNGSIFVKNNVSSVLINAKDMLQTFNQELAQNATMTDEELHANRVALEEMQKQITTGEMKLQWQLEKSKELQLTQEESAALDARIQELIQETQEVSQQLIDAQEACQSARKAKETNQTASETIKQWAQAFCERDGETIVQLVSENVEQQLINQDILSHGTDDDGEEYFSFGWSSPWPWDENAYRIISVTDRTAEILYYAWVSDPHVTVWRELLTYENEQDRCVITSEELQFMDNICTAEEFVQAYPNGIVGTMMDYYSFNGAGEALNENAKENKKIKLYADLFEPDTSAIQMLNLLDNPNKVGVQVEKTDKDADICTVTLEFYEFGNAVNVQMIRPYGSDGIWVPYIENSESLEETDISEDVASLAPHIVTGENVDTVIEEDMKQLNALFPAHHEFAFNMNFPQMIDLNGDGVEEKIEMVDLLYNGGDGGYALQVTDTRTGEQIPLPDGYTKENGFPIFSSYIVPQEKEPMLLIQMGDQQESNTLATIMQDALIQIYERNNMYSVVKDDILNHSNKILADAISGCNIVTYNNEETPVILLKSYISGFAGHVDTLGYVVTELKLQRDNTWAYKHYFLLDSCDDLILMKMEETKVDKNNGISILPFDKKSDINFQLLLPDEIK